jgi:hypothetical protein
MGWCFSTEWASKKELVSYLQRPGRFSDNHRRLKSRVIGNCHWYLLEDLRTLKVIIGLDLLESGSKREPGWGYKSLSENAGPVEVCCPLSFLRQASPPEGYAVAWRVLVEKEHEMQARLKDLVLSKGTSLLYAGSTYILQEDRGRRGWNVIRESDQRPFRMRLSQVKEACRAHLLAELEAAARIEL